ncbi:protein FAM180A [Salminus brasiliensis]|uniref:protein FAM180A n=1 Tax=Salminus brasiliensis TaxID=930266 RepID=UPI003B82E692
METAALVIVCLVLCHLSISAALHWRKALYPSAFRVKRGTPTLLNPSIQRSVEDTDLLYEALWSGLYLDAREGVLRVVDEELASLRRLQSLEVVCEDVLPRTLSDIRRLCHQLEQHRGHLNREDFERTVLTMVYTAQRLAQATPGHQRELWADTFLQLYKAIKGDLRAE